MLLFVILSKIYGLVIEIDVIVEFLELELDFVLEVLKFNS